MKSASSSFLNEQRSPTSIGVRKVFYKRRYWNGSAFVWEGSWTELKLTRVVSVSPVTWQLDTDQLNEFKVSNVTFLVDDSENLFRPDNPSGFFGPDATSPLLGYEPYWTKFQIRAGFHLSDGTDEMLTLFTGLATEYTMDSEAKQCQILVQGYESLLTNEKAEGIATNVSLETIGTGNGSNKDFTTLNPGVGGVTLVTVSGVAKTEGADYSISQLDSPSQGAKISFSVAPAGGATVKATYFYWPQNITFDDLVGRLLDVAGITSGSRYVQSVVFPNSVLNSFNFTSQSDWDSGTKSSVDSATSPGQIQADWSGSAFRQSTSWSTSTSGWSGSASWTSDGTYLLCSGSGKLIQRSLDKAQGCWEFKFTQTATSQCSMIAGFMSRGNNGTYGNDGYSLSVGGGTLNLVNDALTSSVGFSTITNDTSEHTVTIVRNGSGRFMVYFDGVLKINAVDTYFNAGTTFFLATTIGTTSQIKVRDIVVPPASSTYQWTSPSIDFSSAPTAWGTVDHVETANGATVLYETRTSADNSSWDSWLAIAPNNYPTSTRRRYAQLRISGTVTNDALHVDAVFDSIAVSATTSTTNVVLPNLTGSSVYEALQKVGEFTNYEFGFSPDETFFFRSKNAAVSSMFLAQSNFLSRISGLRSGYDKVFGIIRAVYGASTREISDASVSPLNPLARVGNRRYEIEPDSNIQISATADIATGVAQALLTYLSKPHRRLKITTKFLPQIDLSDTITVSLENNAPFPKWYFGDPAVSFGDIDRYWWGDKQQIVSGMKCKVIGARYDVDRFQCEFDLEEVL